MCPICFCEKNAQEEECITLLGCSHWFHVDCISGMVNTANKQPGDLPFCCISPGCKTLLAVADFKYLCTEDSFEKWRDFAKDKAQDQNASIEYCPNRCNTLLQVNRPKHWTRESGGGNGGAGEAEWNPFVYCPSCRQSFCLHCSHKDVLNQAVPVTTRADGKHCEKIAGGNVKIFSTCQDFGKWKMRFQTMDDAALQAIRTRVIEEMSLFCPHGCGQRFQSHEKEACDAVRCQKCEGFFCWCCWKKARDNNQAHACANSHGSYFNDKALILRNHGKEILKHVKEKIHQEIPNDAMYQGGATTFTVVRERLLHIMWRDFRDIGISRLEAEQAIL